MSVSRWSRGGRDRDWPAVLPTDRHGSRSRRRPLLEHIDTFGDRSRRIGGAGHRADANRALRLGKLGDVGNRSSMRRPIQRFLTRVASAGHTILMQLVIEVERLLLIRTRAECEAARRSRSR